MSPSKMVMLNIRNIALWAGLLAGFFLAAGCATVKVNQPSGTVGNAAAAAPVAPDNRTAEQLRQDNAQLHGQLAQLESDHQRWQATVDQREAEIHALKDQRDVLKKDRDQAKKAAKRD